MFCPKCGSILLPKKEGGKIIFKCSCGFKSNKGTQTIIGEKSKKEEHKVDIIETDKDSGAMPKTNAKCSKCSNTKAYFWEVQTRAADEPATKFLKCTKCGHIWRDYS